MTSFLLTLSADLSSLGKVGLSAFSAQTRMELLIQDIIDQSVFQSANGEFLPIAKWFGVILKNANEVSEIDWAMSLGNGGNVHLELAPCTIVKFSAPNTNLEGSIDFLELPQSLTRLNVGNNALSGSIDLTRLPEQMHTIVGNANHFSGQLDLTKLPATMYSLKLSYNALFGQLDFDHLPLSMHDLFLDGNRFTGNVVITNLPQNFVFMQLKMNDFSGTAVVDRLPSKLGSLGLYGCKIEAVIDLNGEPMQSRKILK